MELIETIENFVTVVYHLRWVIGFGIAVILGVMSWSWWRGITL